MWVIGRLAVAALICASLFTSLAHATDLEAIISKAAVGKKPPGAGLLTIQSYAIAGEAVYGVRRLGDPAAVTPGAGLSAAKALAGGK